MIKGLLTIMLITGLWAGQYPKDVIGKWAVDEVEAGEMAKSVPPQNRQMMLTMLKRSFKDASFTLQPDHKCTVVMQVPNMPKVNYWKYDSATGIITLQTTSTAGDKIMMIKVVEQDNATRFLVQETGIVLKVHKIG